MQTFGKRGRPVCVVQQLSKMKHLHAVDTGLGDTVLLERIPEPNTFRKPCILYSPFGTLPFTLVEKRSGEP